MNGSAARTRELLEQLALLQARLGLAEVLKRIRDRAARGRELDQWGLKPQPVDPDCSLAADDAGFLANLGGDYVRTTALYPIMSATDCLVAIAQLVDDWEDTDNSHMVSLVTLCRSALETSAKSVWLLHSPDREERRARCVGFTYAEMSNQKSFHAVEKRKYDKLPDKATNPAYRDLQEHIRLFGVREDTLRPLPKTRPPNETEIVIEAAKWIDRNPPIHDTTLYANDFTLGAERTYRVASSFTHGYKWPVDYVKAPQHAYGMAADGLAAAVGMTECAVALYEVQAQRRGTATDRERRYPERIEPTITAWSTLYS